MRFIARLIFLESRSCKKGDGLVVDEQRVEQHLVVAGVAMFGEQATLVPHLENETGREDHLS